MGYIAAGLLLIGMAMGSTLVKRLPVSASLLYLLIGIALGPAALGVINTDPLRNGHLWEHLAEAGVLLSLLTAGLKLRVPLNERIWETPLRLATVSMVLTVGGIASAGVWGMGMDWGTAVLLGAILAPTDPVLASDVTVNSVGDTDRVRFSLTGEAGLNDGTAMPMALLGLGLLGLREHGWAWWATVDVLWSALGGVLIGALVGYGVGRFVLYLRQRHKTALGMEEFLSLGVLTMSYGLAQVSYALGFLAVFVAGLALRHVEARSGDLHPEQLLEIDPVVEGDQTATDPDKGPAYLAQAVLGFNEQLERIYEMAVVVLIGGLLSVQYLYPSLLWFLPLLFFLIRPAAVMLGTVGACVRPSQRLLIGWFGIRGIGSIYYLAFALNHGLPHGVAQQLVGMTMVTVAASVVVHGISVTPLLKLYENYGGRA